MYFRKLLKNMLICALIASAALSAAPLTAAYADEAVLLKEVMLVRHGVRSPLWKPGELAELTSKKWPEWPVKPGMLSARGAALVYQQWTPERARLMALGVTAPEVFICADSMQRTVQTAEAILSTLSPKQDIAPVVYDRIFVAPIFHPVRTGTSEFDKTAAYKDIIANTGGSLASLKLELAGQLEQITNICGPLSAGGAERYQLKQGDNFLAIPSEIDFGDDGANVAITGGLGDAGMIAENFLMEYCQWTENNAGWGLVNGEVLGNIMPVHVNILDAVNRAEHVALPKASQLTALMTSSLLGSDYGLAKIEPAIKVPAKAAKVSVFVGHDANIAGVAQLLGLNWQLPGFAPNQIPPGSCLVLSLWQRDGRQCVTAEFVGLSLSAFHSNIALPDSVNRVSLPLTHMQMKPGEPQTECAPNELAAWVQGHTQPAK